MADEAIVDAIDPTEVDTPTTDTDIAPEIDADASADVSTDQSTDDQAAKDAAADKDDARTLPKAIKESLAGLKEVNPQAAKALNDAYFRNEQFKKEFPEGLNGARAMKATFEAVGGVEGVTSLQEKSAILDNVDADIAAGNPAVLDDIIADSPDGFKKLVPAIIDRLQNLDAKSYGDALRPHFVATLEAAGLPDVLDNMTEMLRLGDGPGLLKLVQSLGNWYKGLQDQTAQSKTKAVDPERAKFETERTEFQKQKENEFIGGIQQQASKHFDVEITKLITPYLKSKPLSVDGKTDLQAAVLTEALKSMGADKTYLANVKALKTATNRDAAKITRFVNAKFDQVINDAVKLVWSRRYGAAAPGTASKAGATPPEKAAAARVGGNAAPIMIAKKPDVNDIDLTKDPRMLQFMAGRGVMKTGPYKGKLVAWRK